MTNERLNIELNVDSTRAVRSLDRTNASIDELENNVSSLDRNISSLDGGFSSLSRTGGLVGVAIGAVAVATIGAMNAAMDYTKALEELSRANNSTIEQSQALSTAFKSVGFSVEDTASAMKDLRERFGEYTTLGSGAFEDVAEVLQLTEEQAKSLAETLSDRTGQEAFTEIVSLMEQAGASSTEIEAIMESLVSDSSKLLPLLTDNAKELKRLTDQANELTFPFDEDDTAVFKGLNEQTNILVTSFKNIGTAILSYVAEPLEDALYYINKLVAIANKDSLGSIQFQLQGMSEELIKQKNNLKVLESGGFFGVDDEAIEKQKQKVKSLTIEYQNLYRKLQDKQDELANKSNQKRIKSPISNSSGKPDLSGLLSVEDADAEILRSQAAVDGAQLDKMNAIYEAGLEQYESYQESRYQATLSARERELIEFTEHQEALAKLEQDRYHAGIISKEEYDARIKELMNDEFVYHEKNINSKIKKDKEKANNDKSLQDNGVKLAQQATGLIFKDQKAASIATATINTSVGVTAALSKGNLVEAGIIAAQGALQIAAIASTEKGGSSNVPGVEGDNSGVAEVIEPTTNSYTANDTSGTQIEIVVDSDDDLSVALANSITVNQKNGVL